MKSETKKNLLFVLIIVLIAGFAFKEHLIYSDKIFAKSDLLSNYFLFNFNKISIFKYGQFPLWMPNMYAGTPFFAMPQSDTLYIHLIPFLLVFKSIEFVLNLNTVLIVALSGIFMYFFMLDCGLKRRYALISGILFALNGFMISHVTSWIERGKVIMYIPLVLLLLQRGLKEKDWVKYAILTGIAIALQFHGSGVDYFLFSLLIPASFGIYWLFGKNFNKRIVKLLLVSVLVFVVFFGLVAVKLLPMLDFQKYSSKEEGFSFEDSVGSKVDYKDIIKLPFYIQAKRGESSWIGFLGFLFVLFSFLRWKEKKVLYHYLLLIIGILIVTGSYFYYPLWKLVPGFSGTHHVVRNLFIVTFAFSALAGFGAEALFERVRKFKLSEKAITIIYVAVIILLVIDLRYVSPRDVYQVWPGAYKGKSMEEQISNNELLQNLSKEPGLFRVTNIGTAVHSGQATSHIVPLDMQMLYGGTSVWIPEYYEIYLYYAHAQPAKFYGMLNTKYIYSKEPINITGLRFVRKFKECEFCWETPTTDMGISGPYLYLNEQFLPRAYMAENSILVIGEESTAKQTMYSLMLHGNFDPSNTVIIMDVGNINSASQDFLNVFDAVFLAKDSVDSNSVFKLENYVDNGGLLFPDIVNGRDSVTEEDVRNLLISFKGDYSKVKEVNVSYYSPNKINLKINKESGFLVLSEKYFMFPDWEARSGGERKEILRANGINSAVYLEGEEGDLGFEYKPKAYRNGLIITILTIVLITAYFLLRRKKNEPTGHIRREGIEPGS